MAQRPLVSAIIPTYNNAALVAEAVDSALAQTYRPLEVIVVDDGSTDDTAARLAAYGERIRVVRIEHAGPAVARNAGIRAARGEFIAFLDSDDLWLPEKVARSAAPLLADARVGVVYTGTRVYDLTVGREQRVPCYDLSGRIHREVFLECRGVSTSTIITRRICLDDVGLFDETLLRAQDWDLFIRLAERYDFRFVPETLTIRRVHGGSLSVARKDLYREYNLKVIQKAAKRRPDLYGPLVNRALSLAYFRFAMHAYADLDLSGARRDLLISLRLRPSVKAFDYLLRTLLPASLIGRLRRRRIAREMERHAAQGTHTPD